MKPQLLIVMLLLLQCSTYVLSLRCYGCQQHFNQTDCKIETECEESAQYCKTKAHDDLVNQSCEEICAEDFQTICCETDLCN